MSRRYGGIHFLDGDLVSHTMGGQVGAMVYAKAQAFWEGRMLPAAPNRSDSSRH